MSTPVDLVKAVRSGNLVEVLAALDAGASVELADGTGVPGLPLGVACFMGFPDIVRELVRHGAKVNLPDNNEPISPLMMAIRGGKKDVVRLLVELGANVPPGMKTGLTAEELQAAVDKAASASSISAAIPPDTVIEEIVMPKLYGTDTTFLEAEVIKAAKEMAEKKKG